ncbi:PREDICTED: alcohol dehydrogenase-like 4 isoform X2 [Tarenaya hassleriana]|uniref:alcohol dehydrogenase-like 4 isoform X2 n=1 Tax=Tarenaya hassleriana TaxID=28532 RepID=UPI00053C4FF9|nr:PREDICTED: alcohol dehydrogenase-like 4 isoform X2 [Tarenaya hassleriana]
MNGGLSKEELSAASAAGDTLGKVIICRAAVAWGPEEPLVIQQVQVDPPKALEVRVRILFTSICHTDLSAWKGENEAQQAYPRILGHEAAGVVESVGEGVGDMKAGDHVIPIFNGECGECRICKRGKANLCDRFQVNPMKKVMASDGNTRFSTKDHKPIYHFLNTSTFSEYTVIDSACLVKLDPFLPLEKMSLLSCGVSTGVGAAWNVADVQHGSTVAVFGLGAVGLAVAEGARARGASKIIGIDINPEKFKMGKEAGITEFINPKDEGRPAHQRVREITEGGVDYSFECAGSGEALREAFLSTRAGLGLTVLLGVHTSPNLLPLHPMELFEGRSITASVFGGFKGKTQLPAFITDCMNGVVNLDMFISHQLPFEEINKAFQMLDQGKTLRCLLHL